MTRTLISSDKQEIVIGFDAPFCVIGERINPTGRKLLAAEMAEGNYERVISDAIAQVEAGATMLDVNAGIPMVDEPAILAESIKLVQETVDVPLAIDSSIVAALEAGLSVYKGKPLVNSVTGEEERLEVVLPLVKKYNAAVVAISNPRRNIDRNVTRPRKVRDRTTGRILLIDFVRVARRTTATFLQHVAVFAPPVFLVPFREITDPYPCARCAPAFGKSGSHHHGHMTSARGPR